MMDYYSVKKLKWNDLVLVEARVSRYHPTNSNGDGKGTRGRRAVKENEWVARYDLVAVNLLHVSTKKRENKPVSASVSI